MILQQDNRLLIQIPCKLLSLGAVQNVGPLALWCDSIRILKQTHLELGPEKSGHGGVHEVNAEFSGLDHLWNFLEVATWLLDHPALSFCAALTMNHHPSPHRFPHPKAA